MAVNIDDFADFLGGFFNNEQAQEAFQEDPEGFLNQNGFGNVTAFEVEQAANRAFAPEQGATTAGVGPAVSGGGGGVAPLAHPLPDHDALAASPDGGGFSAVTEAINHYTNVYNTTYDNDQAFDTSTNNNITAFGDVELDQDIDTNVASGDGAVAGVEDSQVQTGDGIQAGDDIEDSNLVQGDVEDSVLADDITDSQVLAGSEVENSAIGSDVEDSVLGNAEESIVGSDVDDSAIAFGDGDAINADNVAQGGSTVIDGDVEGNANTGDGDQFNFEAGDDLDVDESAFGAGASVESNDVDIDADDGAAVALGGGDAEGSNTEVDIDDSYVAGNVQAAGADSTQVVDQSTDLNYELEVDTDIEDSFNTDQSVDVELEDVNTALAGDDAEVID